MNKNTINYLHQHLNDINTGKWENVFSQDVITDGILSFEEIEEIYQMILKSNIEFNPNTIANANNCPDKALRDIDESLEHFFKRVDQLCYKTFYTKEYTDCNFDTLIDIFQYSQYYIDHSSDYEDGSQVPLWGELIVAANKDSIPTINLHFYSEDGGTLSIYFSLDAKFIYFPFGLFFDYHEIANAIEDIVSSF